jgi:hypothetical protein
VDVQQLRVSHPGADDDGLWYFGQPASEFQVQIESPDGMCPFRVETDENDERLTGRSVEETVEQDRHSTLTKITKGLHVENDASA